MNKKVYYVLGEKREMKKPNSTKTLALPKLQTQRDPTPQRERQL